MESSTDTTEPWSSKKFLALMTTFPLNVEEIYKYKNEIATEYRDKGYVNVAAFIDSADSVESLQELTKPHGWLWSIFALSTTW